MKKLLNMKLLTSIILLTILLISCAKEDDNTKRKYYYKVIELIDSTKTDTYYYKYKAESTLFKTIDIIDKIPVRYKKDDIFWVFGI